jgi:hypothetical protein
MKTLTELQALSTKLESVSGYSDYLLQLLLVDILIELKLLNEKMDKVNGRKTT